MNFKDVLSKAGDFLGAIGEVTTEMAEDAAKKRQAEREVSRLLGMSAPVARRGLKRLSETLDLDTWQMVVCEFDNIARNDSGGRADLAAELAEYAESLRSNQPST